MPRRSRRMARPPRARRRADWVYRPHIRDETGAIVDGGGSYEGSFTTLVAGIAGIQFRVLYDSFNYRSTQFPDIGGLNLGGALLGSSAKAEGRNPLILRVQGKFHYSPTTWAVGSQLLLGLRFGVFEQDPVSGLVSVDPTYAMLNGTATTQTNPAAWANTRNWVREWRTFQAFASNQAVFQQYFDFKCRRALKPHECFGIWAEATSGVSTNAATQYWFRTLVADEG